MTDKPKLKPLSTMISMEVPLAREPTRTMTVTRKGNRIHLPLLRVEDVQVEECFHGYKVRLVASVRPTPPLDGSIVVPKHDGLIPFTFEHYYNIGDSPHSATEEANAIADAFHEMWAHEVAEHIRNSSGTPYVLPHPEGPMGRGDGWHQDEAIDPYDGGRVER